MTLTALAPAQVLPGLRMPQARVADVGAQPSHWWERRAEIRRLVGGCPDHWWKATAPRSATCTCDRF